MAVRKKNDVEAVGVRDHLNKMNGTAAKIRLGDLLEGQKGLATGLYDFAADGGAVSSIDLKDPNDLTKAVTIPDNAIITSVFIDILTACASSGGTGTIAIDSEGAGDLLAAVDADTLNGIVAGIPVGTAATSVKMTAERTLQITIATEDLTAGKVAVHVEYLQSL